LEYKESLDIKIIKHLLENEKESRNELMRIVGEENEDVFQYHLKTLMEQGTISRSPLERIRGKKVFYSLTSHGKKQYTLKLLEGHKESYIYKRIYEELFFFEFSKPLKFFYTEKDFLTFLKESDITKEVEWAFTGDMYESDIHRIVYPNNSSAKRKSFHKKLAKEFWSKQKDTSIILAELNFLYFLPEYRLYDINIIKTEHWQINHSGNHIKYDITYTVNLPGIESYELIDIITNKDPNITKEQIEHAISLLIEAQLIGFLKIGKFKQMIIKDEKLREFILDIQNFHSIEIGLLLNKWHYFEKPTDEEKIRMEKLFGKGETRRIFYVAELICATNKKLVTKCKTIEEYIKKVKISSGVSTKNSIQFDQYMSTRDKQLFKKVRIFDIVEEYKNMYIEMAVSSYTDSYIPDQIKQIDNKINDLKLKNNQFNHFKYRSNIKILEKKKIKLKNHKNDVRSFYKYYKNYFNYDSDIKYELLIFKHNSFDVYKKYKFLLNRILDVFLPLFLKVEPQATLDYSIPT
jgi:DNA-binding HxlR family transcriptional regulator